MRDGGAPFSVLRSLELRVSLRIHQTVHPLRRGYSKTHRHQLARWRRKAVLRRLAEKMRAISIGDDQPRLFRKDFTRQILRESEKQPIAMGAIVLPFVISPQILQ